MPEGPSITILREEAMLFKGMKILEVNGNSKIDQNRLLGQKIIDIKSWGKHFLICFKKFFVRIHLLMFGSYRINEKKETPVRLSMKFKNGELNFYTCSIKIVDGDINDIYDWEVDTMADEWNPAKALKALKKSKKDTMACDVLLDQQIFSGSGNIIKNEVLFMIHVHPESQVKALPVKKMKELIDTTRNYVFDFYKWKKAFELKKHWLIYRSSTCPRCKIKVTLKHTGKYHRRSFFCTSCQFLYEK